MSEKITTDNKVAYEEIEQIIQTARERFYSAKAKIPKLQEQLDVAYMEWRDGIIGDATEAETTKRCKQIDSLKSQIEILQKLDEGKEFTEYLKRNPKLIEACKQFEEQQLDKLKEVETEKIEAIKEFRAAREPLMKATRVLGFTNCQASRIIHQLDNISEFIGETYSYKSPYRFLYFPEVDIEGRFKREWEGGCRDIVFPEPSNSGTLYPEAQPESAAEQAKEPINESEAVHNG